MPNRSKRIAKWIGGGLAVLVVVFFISVAYVNTELEKMYGARTQPVDDARYLDHPLQPVLIENVHVLSANGDRMIANQSVLLENGLITAIQDSLNIPPNAHLIDGTGQYLIPGLIDAHMHLWQSPDDLLLYIANGITTVRELKGNANHLAWRDEINIGKRFGP